MDVLGQGQGQVEALEHLVMLDTQLLDALLGGHPLASDAGLLLREQRLAYLVGVMGLE
ncbi:MAG TPA: hypothetical protein VF245_05860 [Solirubrobacterales bacterium]